MFYFFVGLILGIIMMKVFYFMTDPFVIKLDSNSIFDLKNFNDTQIYGNGFLLKPKLII